MKIPDAKRSSGQGMKEARNDPRLAVGESEEQEGGYSGSTKRQEASPLCYIWWTSVISKMRSYNQNFRRKKGRVVLRGDIVTDDSWSLRWTGLVFVTNDCSKCNGCHCKTWLWWTSSWRRVSIHSGKDGGCSQDSSQFPSRSVQMYGCVFHDVIGRNLGQTLKIQWFLLNEIHTDTHMLDCCAKDSSRKFCWNLDGETHQIENVCFAHRKQWLFSSENVDDMKMAGKRNRMWLPMWKKLMKNVDLDEPMSFLDHLYLGCTQRECKPNEIITKE